MKDNNQLYLKSSIISVLKVFNKISEVNTNSEIIKLKLEFMSMLKKFYNKEEDETTFITYIDNFIIENKKIKKATI
ncbi:hypothetical protein [Clostridium ganghwense]|uniref:Uncharacterized protein n=1 Tax=Clostridium ganghwense TaxID=312089 RepID=A0ABT4CPS6_9CLOT|nr:hypothetical protein [Clostridium ganghwense]MCY6371057.1 hypothetical protein [Clostridium ganghwense]